MCRSTDILTYLMYNTDYDLATLTASTRRKLTENYLCRTQQ